MFCAQKGVLFALVGTLFFACLPASRGAVVHYTQRVTYFSATYEASGGLYNQGTTEVGMWASSASGYSVGWRQLKTAGDNTGSARELQVGDKFRISVYGHRVAGKFGVSISRNPSTGSWDNRTNASYGFIEMTNYGDFVANYDGGQSSFSGATLYGEDGTFEFIITSTSNFTANVRDSSTWQTPKYDLDFIGNPGTSLVTHWSQYYNDDWVDGTEGRNDSYWKGVSGGAELSVTNLGYVEFGADNGTRTIGGRIQDGLAADSTSTVSTNNLLKQGSGTITLGFTNNIHTGSTESRAGTLVVSADGCLGAAPSAWRSGLINIWAGATLQFSETSIVNTNRGWQLGNVSTPAITVDSGKTVTFAGVMEGGASWSKKGAGTLFLSGNANTNTGQVAIEAGTLRLAATGSLGQITIASNRVNIWSTGTLEFTNTFTLSANANIEIGLVSGPVVSVQDQSTITWGGRILGDAGWSKQGPGTFIISGNQTNAGHFHISNGVLRITHTNGLGSVANGTTVVNGPSLQLSGGIITAPEPLLLNGEGYFGGGALDSVSGNNTFAGPVGLGLHTRLRSQANILTLNSGTSITGSGWNLEGSGAGDIYIDSVIGTGTGGVRKIDGGELRLNRTNNTYSGATTVSGGTVRIGFDGSLGAIPGSATPSHLRLDSGTLATTSTASWVLSANRGISLGHNGGTLNITTGTMTYGGIIAGNGALTKSGGGALVLTGANTYTGLTTVSAGSLIYDGTNTSSAVTVSAGATNMGVGSVGALTVSGQVGPGTNTVGLGFLTVSSLTMNNGSSYRVQIGTWSDTTSRDYIRNTGGAPTINATVTLYVDSSALSGFAYAQSKSWAIITGSVSSASGFSVDETTYWDGGTYPKNGGTFSLTNADNCLVLVYTAPAVPDIAILGTNMAVIATNDTTPSLTDGTHFGYIEVNGGTRSHVFTITNSGAANLGVDTVVIGGTHATNFVVTAQPDTWVVSNLYQSNADYETGASGWNGPGGNSEFRGEYYGLYPKRGTNFLTMWSDELCYRDIAIEANSNYTLSVWIASPAQDGLSNGVHGEIKVEWHNSGGFISQSFASFGTNGGYDINLTPGQWYNYTTNVTAPGAATTARVTFAVWNWSSGTGRGAFDHMQFFKRPSLGSNMQFTVRFDPSAAGTRSATVYLTNNVSGKSPYQFDIQGYGIDLVAPTGCRASVDGHEMIRLDWTNSNSAGVIVVHKMSNTPTALAQGTSYIIGDAVGSDGSRVVGKQLTGTWVEHIVPAGSTNFYTFYSYTDSVYSAGVTVSTNTSTYLPSEIVDALCYTNAVKFTNTLSGGQGWSGAWNAWNGLTIITNDTPSRPELLNMAGYPERGGNRIYVAAPGASNAIEAYRNFPMITTGVVYFAGRLSFQHTGTNRWCGFTAVSGSTHKVIFGETWTANGGLGIMDYGGGQTATNVMRGWTNALTNTYLVIAKYEFASRQFSAMSYPGWMSVTPDEPAMTVSDTMPANYMNGINGIGLKAGSDALGCDIGECYFDEIRVAQSWNGLFLASTPVFTNYTVGTTNYAYDGQVTSGVFTLTATAEDTNGIGTAGLDFDIFNPSGIQILTNEHTDSQTWANNGRTSTGSDTNHAGYYPGDTGTYTARWSVVNSNGFWLYDSISLSNNTIMTFTVVDDDTNFPTFGAFAANGQSLGGATYVNEQLGSGLVVTGLVTDAGSGLYGGTSNTYTLTRNGTQVDSGSFTALFANGSAVSSNGQLRMTFPTSVVQAVGIYTVRVVSADYDADRAGDSLSASTSIAFTVVAAQLYSADITFCGYTRAATLTNFPVLVNLTNIIGFSFAQVLTTNAADLRFYDAQTNELNYELEDWTSNGSPYAWVQMPTFSSSSTLRVRWGSSGLSTLPAYRTNGVTWAQDFRGVWHLGLTERDSTTNRNDATNFNGSIDASGSIGSGQFFDGDNDYIEMPNNASLENLQENNFTMSAWFMPASVPPGSDPDYDMAYAIVAKEGYHECLYYGNDESLIFNHWLTGDVGAWIGDDPFPTGVAYHVVGVLDRTNGVINIYINGEFVDSASGVPGTATREYGTNPWRIGTGDDNTHNNYAFPAHGMIDEVRLESINRSSNWIWAAYMSQASNASFLCYTRAAGVELEVLGTTNAVIVDGDTTPSRLDGTDFGDVNTKTAYTNAFTITNLSASTLGIGPVTTNAGGNGADFVIVSQPASTLAAGATTTFGVQFGPRGTGTRYADIRFTNTTADGAYVFRVQGTGLYTATEFICDVKPSGGDYTSVQSWHDAVGCDLAGIATRVFSGTVVGAVSDGSKPVLYRSGVSQGVTGTVAHVTASQALLRNLSNTGFAIQTGDVWRIDGSNYFTLSNTGDSAAVVARIGGAWTNAALTGFTINAFTNNSVTNYVRIYTTPDARHDGKWNQAAYRIDVTNHDHGVVLIRNSNVEVDGIQLHHVTDITYGQVYSVIATGSYVVLRNLIVWGQDTYGNEFHGISKMAAANPALSIYNSLVYGDYDWGIEALHWSTDIYAYNCTVIVPSGSAAFRRGDGHIYAYNCYAYAPGLSNCYNDTVGGYMHVYQCAGTDRTASPGLTNIAVSTSSGAYFVSTNAGSEDFHIRPQSALVNQGTNLSVLFTTDIDGDYRAAPWDIGVDEVGAISVLGTNLALIDDGDLYPAVADGTDYGYIGASVTNIHTFVITNSGLSNVTISAVTTSGAQAADFVVTAWPPAVSPGTASNLTIRFAPSAAGLRTAVVVIVNGDVARTNYDFGLQGLGLPAPPTAQSATADGVEMVRLAWTSNSLYGTVMILHKQTNAIVTDPTQNTAYAIGDMIDGAKVIHKGTGSSLEHIIAQGSANYYAFYSVNGNYYSTGAYANVTLLSYPPGAIVEPFSYTNGVSPSGRGGGSGFTNNWSVSVPSASNDVSITNSNFSTFQAVWPSEAGNRFVFKTTNTASYQSFRGITERTSGQIYIAALVRRQYDEVSGNNKYSGISLMDGASELTFVGDRGAGDDQFGVSFNSGPGALYGAANSFPEATDYLIIGRYDFGSGIWAGLYYDNGTAVPATEPSFLIQVTQALTRVNGIRLAAGSATVGWPGEVYFDEVRVATNWNELMSSTLPSVVSTSFVVNAGTNVSDGQVTGGTFAVAMHFYDESGVESTNTSGSYFKPNFDIWNNEGRQILTNEVFSSFTYSGDYLAASDASHAGADMTAVVLGTYTTRWSAINSNGVSVTDSTSLSNGTAMTFTVYDDDTTPPLMGVSGTNNIVVDPGVNTNAFTSTGWFGYNNSGLHAWADRAVLSGTNGMAWESWTNSAFGGFGQNLVYNPTNGNVFHFSMYGNAETYFSSTVHEAWMKMQFVDSAGSTLYEVSNSVYNTLVSNRNTWVQFSLGATNTASGVSTVKVIVGYGNATTNQGGGVYAVKWDDAVWMQGRPLSVFIGSTNLTSRSATSGDRHVLTDGQLAGVGAGNPLRLVFHAYDVDSGLSRGNGGASTQMNIDIGSWVTDNTTNYVATNSSSHAATFAVEATSTWAFYGANIDGLIFLTNAVQASLKDADLDRTNDQLTVTNQIYGYLVVDDDDVDSPQVGSGYETNILGNASFELGDGTTTISNWSRSAGNTEHREGRWSSGYLSDTAIPNGTNILKIYGTGAELVQTNISVVAGAFYHGYGQFYHSSTNDPICQTCGEDSLGAFFKVIFYDSSQVPIATNYSGEHNASVPSNAWQYINLYVTAPTNASTATFHIQTSGGTNNGGALYADDFHFTRDARVMQVWVGTNNLSALNDGGTNAIHTLYDSYYVGIAATNKLRLVFGAYDTNSGLDVSLLNIDWENWLTDNSTNYVATNSSSAAETYGQAATSVWVFTATDFASAFNKTNKISLSLFDADNDRSNDRIIITNEQYGYIAVLDDDVDAPVATGFVATGSAGVGTVAVSQVQNGGWSITGLVRDVFSGININGATTSDPVSNISPYFTVYNSTGTAVIVAQIFTNRPADGGATNWTRLAMETVTNTVALGNIPSGVYTVRVTVADNDEDRTNATERAVLTAYDACTFVVPGTPGLGRGPATLNLTSYYGSAVSGTFTVTNIGSGSLTYSCSISYAGVGGWLTVAASNGVLSTAASQIHTASVSVAGLDACDYQATITLSGNQTNSAETVVVNLHVIGFGNNETVESFTNAAGLVNGDAGGNGWTNAWEDDPLNTVTTVASSLSIPGNYPAASGGKVQLETGNDSASEKQVHRHFPGVANGKIFIAAAVKKSRNNNTAGFFGLSMMNGVDEVAFFGKRFGEEFFGTTAPGAGYGCSSAFGMYQTTYFVVGTYDFDTDVIKGAVYNSGDTLPLTEAGVNWRCSNSLASSPITRVDAIRLAGKDVETAEFDEIRVAASWEDLLQIGSDEPTLHGSVMAFSNVSTGQMDVSWNSGNGIRRLVVAREGSAVTFSPTDHVQYVANTNFSAATSYSGNKIVFDGSTNAFTVVGLSAGTNYHFKVFEYNTCGTNLDYLTSGTPLASNRWTLVPEIANLPTSFTAWQKSTTEISNTWVASAGTPAPSAYLILYGTNIPSTAPSDGAAYTNGQAIGNGTVALASPGTASNALHTGLTPCLTYYFRIYPLATNTGGSETYNYLTVGAPTSTAATACTDPSLQASNINFSVVDTNKMTVTWLNGGGEYRMVVARATNAVDSLPVDQTAYTANAVFGSGSQVGTANYVVYSGTGTSVIVSNLLPGVTYHFRVFEFNGTGNAANYNTNTAVGNPASRATAPFAIAYDEFDDQGQGTGQLTDNGRNDGGVGWTNNWTQSFSVEIVDGLNMPVFKCYPRIAGSDMIRMSSDTNNHEMWRYFARRTSGRIYAAYLMNLGAGGTNTYAGLSFYNGSTETAYVGKIFSSSSNVLGVAQGSSNEKRADYVFGTSAGDDYLVVTMYDFETDTLAAKAYTTNYFAHVDPSTVNQWDAMLTNVAIEAIDGVRLAKKDTGVTYFDEIRVGATWEQVMIDQAADPASGPVPTLIYIGPAFTNGAGGAVAVTNLTDADLSNTNEFDFAIRWDDPQGIFLTNANNQITAFYSSAEGKVIPNWDPVAPGAATNSFGNDNVFTSFYGFNGATSVTTYQYNAFYVTNLDITQPYFVTVSAQDDPTCVGCTHVAPTGDAVACSRAITVNYPVRFYMTDDDEVSPLMGATPLSIVQNGSLASFQDYSGTGTLRRYFLTDGSLTSMGFSASFNIYDSSSGLRRAAGGAVTNMNVSINQFVTNEVGSYASTNSSASALVSSATSTWAFAATNFSYTRVGDMYGGGGTDLAVIVNAPDGDNDRTNDTTWASNLVVGYIQIQDDDVGTPVLTNIGYGGNSTNKAFWISTNNTVVDSGQVSGTDTNAQWTIYDGDLANTNSGYVGFAFGASDVNSGVGRGTSGSTNSVMSVSVGSIVQGNFTNYSAAASSADAAGVPLTNVWSFAGAWGDAAITGLMAQGSNEVAVTVPDSDNDRTNDQLTIYSTRAGWLKVLDDDTNGPVVGGSPLTVMAGGTAVDVWTNAGTTNAVWRVSDGQFYSASVGSPLAFSFNVHDTSGIRRGTVGAATNMNIDIQRFTTNNTANYAASKSSANTAGAGATSVWEWTSGGDQVAVSNLFGSGSIGLTNVVQATIRDDDNDWVGDNLSMATQQFGYIWLYDDDTDAPVRANLLGENLLTNSGFEEAGWWSGIADGWDATNAPYLGNTFGNYLRSDFRSHGGQYSATVPGNWGPHIFTGGGWYQGVTNSYGDDVVWRAAAWAISDGSWSANYCAVSIEFYQADNATRIGAVTNTFSIPSNAWTYVSVVGTSPAGTVWSRIVLTGDSIATNFGSLYFDDAVLQVVSNAVLPMDVQIGNVSYYREGSGTNGLFQVTDQDLAGVSPTNTLKFVFRIYDPTSGVERSSTEEYMNYDIGGYGSDPLSDIYDTYSNSLSSASADSITATSVFAHVTNLSIGGTHASTNFAETGEVYRLISAATNPITVSYPNGDADRGAVDREWVIDGQFGRLVVQDEDVVGPVATIRYIGTNYTPGAVQTNELTDADLIQGGLDFAYEWVDANGLFLTNNTGHQTNDGRFGNLSMNWELVGTNGVQYGADTIHPATSLFASAGNGSIYATAVQYNVSLFTYTNMSIGTWSIQASAQDMDNDRGMVSYNNTTVNLDRATRADMPMYFTVRDDDSNYPSANNLVINDRYATNVIYDGELSTGFSVRLRFWDDRAGAYIAASNGAFNPPNFSIVNPSNQVVQTNQTFGTLQSDYQLQITNAGFETASGGSDVAYAWSQGSCGGVNNLLSRTNDVARSGAWSLGAIYNTSNYGETAGTWVDVSGLAVGEKFVFGGYVRVSNALPGSGRAVIKFEWWDSTNCSGFQGFEVSSWVTDTTGQWASIQVSQFKPYASTYWARVICEVTAVEQTTNVVVNFDDMYVGSPSNVIALRAGVTVPYSNIFLGDYTFQWSAQDSDNDRTNDTLGYTDTTNMGTGPHIFNVQDDAPGSPTGINLYVLGVDKETTNVTDQQIRNGQWSMGMRIIDPSGVATSGVGDEWVPNYSMLNAAGTGVHSNEGWTSLSPDSTATNLNALRVMGGVNYESVDIGWYSILFSAQNMDNDRPFDRGAVTNFGGIGEGGTNGHQFWVRDDDTNTPSMVSTVAVDVVGWTNINLFNVTFNAATDDYSGIYQYRYDTNVTPSTSATNGEVVSGLATTELPVAAFTNKNFEIGQRGQAVPNYDPDPSSNLYGWSDFSADNASGIYWDVAQSGTGSMRHIVDAGDNAGVQRYTLIGQQVAIGNSNGYPVRASFSASFSGDVSQVANSAQGVAFLKMEFFDASTTLIQTVDNEYNTDHNGAPLAGVFCHGWSNVTITATNGPANTRLIRFMMGVAQHGTDLAYTGYWDNVSATVKVIGVVGQAYSFAVTNVLEGIRTNSLFAVDDDDDRLGDRLKGANTNFITMLDLTPPAKPSGLTVTNGLDDATEMRLDWTALANAGSRSDGEPLSPWRTYYVYYEECTNCNVTTNSPSLSFTNGLPNLGTNTTTFAIISNLNFDSTYRFVVAGQDRAGNLGTLSDTVTLSTLNFIVTQGIVAAASRVDISWMSSTNRTYDMLWVDGAGYSDTYSNYWTNLMGTVTNSFISDTGSATRVPPTELTNGMRFFRVSREGQWATNVSPRRASKEIYVSKAYVLRPGENWISMPMLPDSNRTTVAEIFGTDRLPSSSTIANATKMSWYGNTVDVGTNSSGIATNVIWLSAGGGGTWLYSIPASMSGQNANNWVLPTNEAFNIEIPGTVTQKLVLVGRLPTNSHARTIYGQNGQTNYNILCYSMPALVTISNLGLKGAGFVGGSNPQRSDEIRILDNSQGIGSMVTPKRRIWMNSASNFVFAPPYSGSAENYVVEPGEALIIVRKRGPSMTWTNRIYYSVPGKNINP